jgi:hypothetical protein
VDRYEVAIEVIDGAFPASSWQQAYGDALTNAAMSWSGLDWEWRAFRWGLLFMVAFPSEAEYDEWRKMPVVVAALDAVPNGVVFHRGWGGTSGGREPRKPRPIAGAGAAELAFEEDVIVVEEPHEPIVVDTTSGPLRTAACA